MVTVAAAPDFTEDGYWAEFSDAQKAELESRGHVELPSDYMEPYVITRRLIEEAGFSVEIDRPRQPTNAEELLSQVQLDAKFASYPLEELLPTAGHFVAFKRAA